MTDMIDSKVEVARASLAGTGLLVYGLTLNEWVAAVTLFYLLLQIIILVPKAVAIIRKWFSK